MKIKQALFTAGYSSFYFDDQQAIKNGAGHDGFIYTGAPVTPGFTSVRQAGECVSVQLILENGAVAVGDCAAVQYSGAGGRDPLFLAENFIPFLNDHIKPLLEGRDVDTFLPNARFFDKLRIDGHLLHTAVRYGLSQALLDATAMLACGEDLGMIPDSVPETMRALQILSLEIQRMPKSLGEVFADPARYPYFSVCTTSTHDMNPLRAWWEENRELSERFYREVLGMEGDAPRTCEPWICRRIVDMHLRSPAMLAILPLQDWLATDAALRRPHADRERINIPAAPRYYWRYRMHLTLEELLRQEPFNATLREMIIAGGRR